MPIRLPPLRRVAVPPFRRVGYRTAKSSVSTFPIRSWDTPPYGNEKQMKLCHIPQGLLTHSPMKWGERVGGGAPPKQTISDADVVRAVSTAPPPRNACYDISYYATMSIHRQ
jgi:hypothetical protein